jgi:site-specific DNA-methyltransferase (adenine-specific)
VSFDLLHGDCLELMAGLPDASVDSIVTDPPYGLSFMGKGWDHAVPGVEFWQGMLRVAKPGAYLLAFGGSRTFHRMACAIEDAGWEIRDTIMWLYGSGFPKSHNGPWGGTALKPAHEPIIMARKPLIGTVAANVLAYGTGGLNIDGCRVETSDSYSYPNGPGGCKGGEFHYQGRATKPAESSPLGRWPANVIHDGSEEVLAGFPQTAPSSDKPRRNGEFKSVAKGRELPHTTLGHADNGGSAARFFYCAKASKRDRDEGLDAFEARQRKGGFPALVCNVCGCRVVLNYKTTCGHDDARREAGQARKNIHPTVKPTDLMRYLCRLVTPAGGVVLDPFMGSGSTGKAALAEGFRFTGIERDPSYFAIASERIAAAQRSEAA